MQELPTYAYRERLLIARVQDCKSIEELVDTGIFYRDMAAENLIRITWRIRYAIARQQEKIIFNNK